MELNGIIYTNVISKAILFQKSSFYIVAIHVYLNMYLSLKCGYFVVMPLQQLPQIIIIGNTSKIWWGKCNQIALIIYWEKRKLPKLLYFSNIKNVYCYSYTTFHTSNYELFTFMNIIFGICMKRQCINWTWKTKIPYGDYKWSHYRN